MKWNILYILFFCTVTSVSVYLYIFIPKKSIDVPNKLENIPKRAQHSLSKAIEREIFQTPETLGAEWTEDTDSKQRNAVAYFKASNKFQVPAKITRMKHKLNRHELLCQLKTRVPLTMIKAGDGPFTGEEWEKSLPKENLEAKLGPFKRCAVVMSAAALRNSKLGVEIDDHDAVIRFNGAPTKGFSVDVGNKTTLRLFNSQLMVSQEEKILTNPLYNTGVLIVWDPAPYSKDLHKWYQMPDFNFFQLYKDFRSQHPDQPFYILSPEMQWHLWDIIQENTVEDIQPNPPSSGMLGIALMMNLCDKISVYEFLPSHRKTDICHYFQNINNQACTVGYYHPMTFEKKLVKRIIQSKNYELYTYGRVTLSGFSQYFCPPANSSSDKNGS
ncbi:SIAT1 sialyltransferase, partial [Amia calva]|nr:SIAT1 sialyltransferase [Amia calva]